MIYLDNAATSFPKPKCVNRAVKKCIEKYSANPGRSAHKLAIKASEEVYKTREFIGGLLSVDDSERIVFTLNATYALNIAIKSTITEKCHVLISDIEHNSVLRPIMKLLRTLGVEYSLFATDGDIEKNISAKIRPDTKAIISTLASNVTGKEIPLKVLSKIRKKHSLKLIVDASQAIGHKRINLKETPCDILCAPGHKALFGIQGCGFAVFCDRDSRDSFIEGGSGTDSLNPLMPETLPEHFEAGTLPTPAIVSLGAGIEYINSLGIDNVERKLSDLTEKITDAISEVDGIRIYGHEGAIISFSIDGIPSSVVARELDGYNICVRSGLHCAPMTHEKLGTTKFGLTRVSVSVLNDKSCADKLFRALKEIKNKY